ncbi:restriction endonuclease subunit S [Alicyclobacillus tolerans]|uniref:restriction endonuclease subunit S n=1 Tax=Alicyclobacillus tolerans TaxID=90970 RepID=UPI003B7D125E
MVNNDWQSFSLRNLGELKYGKSPKETVQTDSGHPIIGTSGIVGYSEKSLFNAPLIMVGRKGTIDKPLFIEQDCWIIDTAYGLLPDNTVADVKWLYYFLSNYGLSKLNEATGVPSLSRESLYNIEVPAPPLSEQRKIAAILTSVDDAIAATQRIIDQTDVVKRGLMQQLLTKGIGHTTFKQTEIGEIPTEWDVKTIGDILVDCQYGLSESLSTEPVGIPVLRMNNIQSGMVIVEDLKYLNVEESSIQNYILNMDDVLFNRTNSQDLVGKTAIFKHDGKFTFASYLIRVRGNKEMIDQNFLNYYMNSDAGQARIRAYMSIGVSQSNINATNLKKVYLPLPPLKEQRAIVDTLSSVDAKIENEKNALSGLNSLKQALMQVLLTGKVRVNVDESSEVSV